MSFQEMFKKYAKQCLPWEEFPMELYEAIQAEPQTAADVARSYLADALQDANVASREGDAYQELMCALAIVTGLRDKQSFPLVLRFADEELVNELLGDYTTELYQDMIARTYNGDMEALVRTVAGENTDEFAAEAILVAMGMMKWNGDISKEDYEHFISRVFEEEIDNEIIMTGAVESIIEADAKDLAYRIDEVNERGLLLDIVNGTVEECKEDLALGGRSESFVEGGLLEWMRAFF